MNLVRPFGPLQRLLARLSRAQVMGLAILGVFATGLADFEVGHAVSLSVFYLIPVGIATWYAGLRAGLAVAAVSTLSVLVADLGTSRQAGQFGLTLWNGLLHLGIMLVVSYLLDSLRAHVRIEADLARSDPVTGIFNRRAFLEQLQLRLDFAARDGKPLALAYLDLDDFKRINDAGGHEEGDRVLRLVASTVARSIRRTDVVARLGGDEFALLLTGADPGGAESLIEKVREALHNVFSSDRATITCSIGCVTFSQPPADSDVAIRAADSLMYQVKSQGKNAAAYAVFPTVDTAIS